ncbi:MAG: ABC transporter ATP-binding protein [Acidimicrobiales bacterium]
MKSPWFVRRRFGYGVRPASWQGWMISAVALVLIVATLTLLHGKSVGSLVVLAIVVVYLAVGYATGGSKRAVVEPPATEGDRELGTHVELATQPSSSPLSASEIRSKLSTVASEAPLAGEKAIEVVNLTKRFGDRTAFSNVTFSVLRGEVFGFLGPNGAGKTTTVRTLSTLISATSGSAMVAGLAVNEQNEVEIRQRISVMPEVPGLYSRLSVTDNLEFFVGLYDLNDAKGRIARALEAVNLSSRADDVCGSLSKGLRQRVSIARALLNDPEIIFLDEPTSGLDPVATREVSELIESLRSRGVTIFLTTHRLEEAERLCDRVAILNTTLRTVGRIDDLRQQLFNRSLLISTTKPLQDPDEVFLATTGVVSWSDRSNGGYEVTTSDPTTTAPALVRALVAHGADVISVGESHHSLEDVYLQLVGDDSERGAK